MKKSRKEIVKIKNTIAMFGVVFLLITLPASNIFLVLCGIAVVIASNIYGTKHLKCPHCGNVFSNSEALSPYCYKCGGKLEE